MLGSEQVQEQPVRSVTVFFFQLLSLPTLNMPDIRTPGSLTRQTEGGKKERELI